MDEFCCVSVSPIHWSHPGVAIATARAGGIAVLDCELCGAGDLALARRNLLRLLDLSPPGHAVGLRLHAGQIPTSADLLEALGTRPHWLLIGGWREISLSHALAALAPCSSRKLWLELLDGSDLEAIDESVRFDGWLAKGSESGGYIGKESAFVLAQRLARQRRPFLVQGGIGLHSAAACRAVGAAGVVLDDQLLLMRESPLPEQWRASLARLGGTDAITVGELLGAPLRIAVRPDLGGGQELVRRAEQIAAQPLGAEARRRAWLEAAHELVGWDKPDRCAWPVGQGVGRAAAYASKYRTTGRLIQALREAAADHIELSRAHEVLAPESPLARSHGTRYPIVQGPMTRVSDRSEFAAAVAGAGALPLLALALMRRPELDNLLRETRERLGDRPWGVGILGFVPPEVRQEQLTAIAEARPRFVLISGGRPDQAAHLSQHGIATYLHAPTPALLRIFLENGARRFVFEGSECGGHYGPLTSFSLWDAVIDELVSVKDESVKAAVHVLFAGGIHDARSAAMVAVMAAPLAAAGFRIGVLMGTAYLFTTQAVASGAIVEGFQRQAIACHRTASIETGPGHVIRCVPTPFVDEFNRVHAQMRHEGRSTGEITDALGQLILGRSRIASKGLDRDPGGELGAVGEQEQTGRGLYMIGDVAMLRAAVVDIETLHADVSAGSQRWIAGSAISPVPRRGGRPAEVAIVGAACLLPKAQDQVAMWRNLLDKVDTIGEIPRHRWDFRLYYDPDPRAEDKVYSKWGGFIDELPFDPLRYGIPPRSLKSISIAQLLALEVTRRALDDAGYSSGGFDRENTAIILAVGAMADLEYSYILRSLLPLCVDRPSRASFERLSGWTEESYAGVLPNVVAGRIANQFDLGGPNFAVDSACSSSLTALDIAVTELVSGRSNMAIAGAVDLEQTPYCYMGFSKSRAFSPRGRANVFDKKADGIVISEGVVVMILKRLADAERDGDHIYAVVQAVAGSSDGKGMGLTAPKSAGQRLAVERVYERAGIDPTTIGMYEAHGTGTAVGDRTEVETITSVLKDAGARAGSCAIGSAKSLLGHTKGVAGMVGVLKAMLALEHRVLPPHAGVDDPIEPLKDDTCPVYLLDEPQPWLGGEGPRRAGVSAFGFGGTNFHVLLEEYQGHFAAPALGAADWPHELIVVKAPDRQGLMTQLERLEQILLAKSDSLSLRDIAFSCALAASEYRPSDSTVCMIVKGFDALRDAIRRVLSRLERPATDPLPPHIQLRVEPALDAGKLAFLFPGQGSQYPGMGREIALYFPEMRSVLELSDQCFLEMLPRRLSRFILPSAAFTEADRERQRRELTATRIAQPAIGVISAGLLDIARRVGLRPDLLAGHSYGELTALHAAGVLSRREWLGLSEVRGRLMQEAATEPGTMAAVMLARSGLERVLQEFPTVRIANFNAPDQCVISGDLHAVRAAIKACVAQGIRVQELPVSAAFHSQLMRPVKEPFTAALEGVSFRAPQIDVYANATGAPYPHDPSAARAILSEQLESPVDFVSQIRRMHDDGARTFVELGPKSTLSTLVHRILDGEPHTAISFDGSGGGLLGMLQALGTLAVSGATLDLPALFDGRPVQQLDLHALAAALPGEAPRPHWFIDGGRIRRGDEPVGLLGERPLIEHGSVPELSDATVHVEDAALVAYRDYQETMRQFLTTQERVTTELLHRFGGQAQAAEMLPSVAKLPAERAIEPPALPPHHGSNGADGLSALPSAPAMPEPATLRRTMIALVSSRTGYPEEMLGLDQDMEAHLGIDSIKRIEILEALMRELPPELSARLQSSMDRLSQIKSMNGLVDVVMSTATALPGAGTIEGVPDGHGIERPNGHGDNGKDANGTRPFDAQPSTCPRFVMRAERKEMHRGLSAPVRGLFLVTEDDSGVSAEVCARLARLGADAITIPQEVLEEAGHVVQHVASLRNHHGPVRGVIHLTSMHRVPVSELCEWRNATRRQTKGLFYVVQSCAADLAESPGEPVRIIAATMLGGLWGRGGDGGGSAAGGGCHGILRCVAREYPRAVTKMLDFDDSEPANQIAHHVVDELLQEPNDFEVGYPNGRRTVFSVAPAPLGVSGEHHDWQPGSGWVVLLTGGARGITAEIACRMARPGVHMVVAGRGAIPAGDDLGEDGGDLDALRRRAIARANREGRKLSPAAIEAEIRDKLHARHRYDNLERLRKLGVSVEYHSMDVSDGASLGALIADVYQRFGRLDAVVHGAGVIHDQLLIHKQAESFDRVFDTKADSTFVLGQALRPDSLKWLVLFGSVTGRFGNRGQVDYAAANEIMNRLAWQLDARWPATRVVVINWGPWREAGMAGEGALRQLEAQGMVPIGVEAGCRFFADELSRGSKGHVEVVAGEGPWNSRNHESGASVAEPGVSFTPSQPLAGE